MSILASFTIKRVILSCCAIILLLIISSNTYTFFSNQKVIAQQESLLNERLKKLLIAQTITSQITQAQLEFNSYLLFEKQTFATTLQHTWETGLDPALKELQALNHTFRIAAHQQLIKQLLVDVVAYQSLQQETMKQAKTLFDNGLDTDTIQAKLAKDQLLASVSETQYALFQSIQAGADQLATDQRRLIGEESQLLITHMKSQQSGILFLVFISIVLAGGISYGLISATIAPLITLKGYLSSKPWKIASGAKNLFY